MQDPVDLLFVTPDGKNLIWENDTIVNHYVTFSGIYISSLDDSVQEKILKISVPFKIDTSHRQVNILCIPIFPDLDSMDIYIQDC